MEQPETETITEDTPVAPEIEDKYWVPENQRVDVDEGEYSDAMDDDTGDDMDGWVVGDPL